MSLSLLFQHLKSRTFIFLFGKELQLFEHNKYAQKHICYVSFATQKRKIIREGTPRALKFRWWFCLLCPHKVRERKPLGF